MALYEFEGHRPVVPESAFVADDAVLIGKVILGERASVWPGAVIRGDNEPIVIGAGTNIQDCAVLHTDLGFPMSIGEGVSVGHQVMLHGCTIGAGCLIGIQSVVMNRVTIGDDSLVGAGTIIPEGKSFPAKSLLLGVPAKIVREITDKDIEMMRLNAEDYVNRRGRYLARLKRIC
jgi:carbonic anhydrase/acetyltransferase-like protein (isoleucine patch superfamily)